MSSSSDDDQEVRMDKAFHVPEISNSFNPTAIPSSAEEYLQQVM